MENILVSVVVPIYNVSEYLVECLESLKKQTLTQIEVIMVNDGSTDDSGKIAEQYQDKNPNFMLLNKENRGLSAARNTGMDVARGKYVYFLDGDDYLAENALESLYAIAEREKLDVVKFSAYTFQGHAKEFTWQHEEGYQYKGDYPEIYNGPELFRMTVDNGDYYPSCCLLFAKLDLIKKNHLRFVEGIVNEDNLFHFQLMSVAESVKVVNEPFYFRRIRCGSITQVHDWMKKNKSLCISAERADAFVQEHGTAGKNVKWFLLFLANTMFLQWEQMPAQERYSKEATEYFGRVKPLLRRYNCHARREIQLYYFSRTLHKIYLFLKKR